jgi:uncharacterized protein
MNDELGCALITGASLGLGRAFARECAARGMDLVLVALPGSGLPELSEALARERGVSVEYLEADLTDGRSLESLARLMRSRDKGIGLLVNNAGIGKVGEFLDRPIVEHEATIRLNCLSLVRITGIFLDALPPGARGRIINVASLGASFPMPTLSVYSATKSFVLSYSLSLREELAGRVGVSVLCPNAIRTTDDVTDYVERFGLAARLACLSPERVAREGLDGAARGKAVIVPGAFNRALAAAGRLVPRPLAMAAIRRCWSGFARSEGAASCRRGPAYGKAGA